MNNDDINQLQEQKQQKMIKEGKCHQQDNDDDDVHIRIACLTPSATDICLALGLEDCIVGITHECNLNSFSTTKQKTALRILTKSGFKQQQNNDDETPLCQADIHNQVASTCQQRNNNDDEMDDDFVSLYPILKKELKAANPTLIITQDLCNVCAPSSQTVHEALADDDNNKQNNTDSTSTSGGTFCSSSTTTNGCITILSLSPHSLQDVLNNILHVARACHVEKRGHELYQTLQQRLQQLHNVILQSSTDDDIPKPRILFLEWLDPPFDAGHWIPDMMNWACLESVLLENKNESKKSIQLSWEKDIQPHCHSIDLVVVASCGFDVKRNYQDALAMENILTSSCCSKKKETQFFATNADLYFARPAGPNLITGILLLALMGYNGTAVVDAIWNSLDWVSEILGNNKDNFYQRIYFQQQEQQQQQKANNEEEEQQKVFNKKGQEQQHHIPELSSPPPDIEDDFQILHRQACAKKKFTYLDPETGYTVFTELAHLKRGKCCGAGCRHCPFHHENVKPEAMIRLIQQPALLYIPSTTDENGIFASLAQEKTAPIRVLFFSGGKDSFLTIRALVRQAKKQSFALVLLTTFDAKTRIIANQEINIDSIVRQAKHLGLTLCGIPMHRASSEGYVERIRRGLNVIEQYASKHNNNDTTTASVVIPKQKRSIQALVFGDLHLNHIRDWRQDQLGRRLGYEMQYPLWKMDYNDLARDLQLSRVPCIVSNSLVDRIKVGSVYNASFRAKLKEENEKNDTKEIDLFGENGEFHTLAHVWEVDCNVALGIDPCKISI